MIFKLFRLIADFHTGFAPIQTDKKCKCSWFDASFDGDVVLMITVTMTTMT